MPKRGDIATIGISKLIKFRLAQRKVSNITWDEFINSIIKLIDEEIERN